MSATLKLNPLGAHPVLKLNLLVEWIRVLALNLCAARIRVVGIRRLIAPFFHVLGERVEQHALLEGLRTGLRRSEETVEQHALLAIFPIEPQK